MDSGEIKVYDKQYLDEQSVQKYLAFPVLKLAQAMIAIIAQYKDPKGTLEIYQPPSQKSQYKLQPVMKIETFVQSFTTFTSTLIQGEANDFIMIATAVHDRPYVPKIWLLNESANGIKQEVEIENRSIVEAGKEKKTFAPKSQPKEEKKKTAEESKKKGGEDSKLKKPSGKEEIKGKTSGKDKKEEVKDIPKSKPADIPPNSCPELFIGYESGAIGAFKIKFDYNGKLSCLQVISTQKVIQDPNIHHVLSLETIYLKPDVADFKLAVGYYSQIIQTLDFTQASDGDTYQLFFQNQTEATYSEKPGIGTLDSLVIDNKALLMATLLVGI
ncbi:UNKNOWN [Stylonychia lemnae]|uniref:Uncharacterized protein n=1 Tax=Stylonychia lemnae TaxID=5949 RepID=A0A077ZQP8_STYLE|nr:UNKNOWN [Stylonychia lemnae]|eukprot:CDW71774.1 UNKNOWN [Stylonychia lemnae]